jgi:two-component system chemotaxis sensor kinase CheA
VRKAEDHGLEKPEIRRASGEPVEGKILFRAYHQEGKVNIEITDDGAGINVEKLRANAVVLGLITTEQCERMSDRESAKLLFHPGLSD